MRRLGILLAIGLLSCGEGSTTETTPQSFSLSLSTTSLVVEQEGVASAAATIARQGGFSETVYLSVSGLPEGVAAAFNPNTLGAASTGTTLTISATSIAVPGTYAFTVRAQSGTAADPQATTVQITITAKPAVQLAVPSASVEVVQGATTTLSAQLTRINYAGVVSVELFNAPPGIGATISPSGDSYQVALSVAEDVSPSTYSVSLAATGVGVSPSSVSVSVTVMPKPKLLLSLSASSASVLPGTSTSFVLSSTRIGFADPVSYSVLDLPTGVTAVVDEVGGTASVTLGIAGDVIPGSYRMRIQATAVATGATVQLFTLEILPPIGSIALSAQQPTVSVVAGGVPVSAVVGISRSSYAGLVTFRTSQLPAGVQVAYSSGTLGGSALFTFTVASTTPLGSYPILITGQGLGIANATTQLMLVVSAPSVGSIALNVGDPALTASVGQRLTTTALVARTNYSGAVSVTASAPPSVQVTISAVVGVPDEYSVEIIVGTGTPSGAQTVLLSASGSGVATAQASVTITVPPSGISISLSSASVIAAQGGSTTVSGTIHRTNFDGAVTVTVSGVPATVSAVVTQNGDAFDISVLIGAATPFGVNSITVTAVSGGHSASTTFILDVNGTPPGVVLTPTSRVLHVASTGVSQTISVAILRQSFVGAVSFSLERGPAGITLPRHSPIAVEQFAFAVSVPITTPAGTYVFDLVANGSQGAVGRVSLTLLVPVLPHVELVTTDLKVTLTQGVPLQVPLSFLRFAYTGPVGISTSYTGRSPAPVAALVGFDPLATGATFQLTADFLVEPGIYELPFSISFPNYSPGKIEITVVRALPAPTRFTFCASAPPIWVAASGIWDSWGAAAPLGGGSFSANIPAVGALAWVTQSGQDDFSLHVVHGTVSEIAGVVQSSCPTNRAITGAVSGLSTGEDALISYGSASAQVSAASPSFSIQDAPHGIWDVLAARLSPVPGGKIPSFMLINRSHSAGGGSLGTIDLSGSGPGFVPELSTVFLHNPEVGEAFNVSTTFRTALGSEIVLPSTVSAPQTWNVFSVPVINRAASDMHRLSIVGTVVNNGAIRERGTMYWRQNPASFSTYLPDARPLPPLTAVRGPYVRPVFGDVDFGYDVYASLFDQRSFGTQRTATMIVFKSALPRYPIRRIEIPDFISVAGWQNTWGLQQPSPFQTTFTAEYSDYGLGVIVDGARRLFYRDRWTTHY